MATDPLIPPLPTDDPPRRIFAEQVDRGNGLADLQGVRLYGDQIGEGDHLPMDTVLEVFARLTDPGGTSSRGFYSIPQTILVGDLLTVTGQTAATYAAGDQVGDPTLLTLLGGNPVPAGATIAIRNLSVRLLDPEKQLDNAARAWLVNDFGGGIGDGGDNTPMDLSALGLISAVPLRTVDPASTSHDDVVTGRVITTGPTPIYNVTDASYLVIETVSGGTWSAPDLVGAVWGGEFAGVIRS